MASNVASRDVARDVQDDQVKDLVEEAEGTDSEASANEAAIKQSNASEVRRQQTAKFKPWYVHITYR